MRDVGVEAARAAAAREAEAWRGPDLAKELAAIAKRCAALPVLDDRTAADILGYGGTGLPS
jgi:antitoxin VapB